MAEVQQGCHQSDGDQAQSKAERRRDFEAIFANTERAIFTPIDPRFRVIGDHGIAWGHWALSVKPKDGPADTNYGRFTINYIKTNGKWLAISEHFSALVAPN